MTAVTALGKDNAADKLNLLVADAFSTGFKALSI
jgi:hypothetical protein